jgi:spore coat protein U-like protein
MALTSFMGLRTMKHKQTLSTLFLLMVSFFAMPVYAVCQIDSVNGGNFGTVTTTTNDLNRYLADITVTCDRAYLVGLDAGAHFLSGSRQLDYASQPIAYTLYQAASPQEWGTQGIPAATNPYSTQLALSGSSGTTTHKIYASAFTQGISPAQNHYSDTVNVILAETNGTIITTTTLNFNLNLAAVCTLDTNGLATSFGTYPIGGAAIANISLGSIAATCPAGIAYKIGIDAGSHAVGNVRQLELNGDLIPYTLKYGNGGSEWGDNGLSAMDSGYTQKFSIAAAVSGTGSGNPDPFAVYGDAQIQNATVAGTYKDTFTVTLVW